VRRLVVVSNRLPVVREVSGSDEPEIPAGGLASAVFAALRRHPGSAWLGWSGRIARADRAQRIARSRAGGIELLGLPLTQREASDYYLGFCNAGLWPLFHCFQGRVRMTLEQEHCYRGVQRRFAAALRPFLRPNDLVWVHDYHFLLLARELRRLGWNGRIGFFMHIPFPSHDLWCVLPDPADFLRAMLQYDLVGFQTTGHLDNYLYCCARELKARRVRDQVVADGRAQRVGVYPVGIDSRDFLPAEDAPPPGRRRGILARVVRGRRLILGVDRLDYTKGIPERILAFEEFLGRHPEWRKKVSFIQIASPSRTSIGPYLDQKRTLEALVGRVNGEMAEHDWVPIRYLNRSYSRSLLGRFYREAAIGLVTPLRDGMNLVAKEFVAAQHPRSPGVLVLSRCAGAAEDLPEALIVNPYISAEVADGIARALAMPLEERIVRHQALLRRVLAHSVQDWGRTFLEDLDDSPAHGRE
jgi:trehalose 6-phosphate synthase